MTEREKIDTFEEMLHNFIDNYMFEYMIEPESISGCLNRAMNWYSGEGYFPDCEDFSDSDFEGDDDYDMGEETAAF